MATSRDIGDLTTDPGGKSGDAWTGGARASVRALWDFHAGVLENVSGVNSITATLPLSDGFSALTDGMSALLVASNTNTGAVALDIESTGAKSVRDKDGIPLGAGDFIAGAAYLIVFFSALNQWRVMSGAGTTNVTIQGGIILQRSLPARLATQQGPTTAVTSVATRSFSVIKEDNRVIVEGNVSKLTGAGASDNDGLTVHLYVDDVAVDSFTDHIEPSSHANTPVYFEYAPGDTDTHTYEIRAASTLDATYSKSACFIACTEMSPNA